MTVGRAVRLWATVEAARRPMTPGRPTLDDLKDYTTPEDKLDSLIDFLRIEMTR